jgi:RNA polymerase sigma factor (sigma-70 family)
VAIEAKYQPTGLLQSSLPTGRKISLHPVGCQDVSPHESVGQDRGRVPVGVDSSRGVSPRGRSDRHPPLRRSPPGRPRLEESVNGNGSDGSRTHERIGEGLHHGRPSGVVRRSSPTGGWGPRPPRTGRRRSSAGPYSPGRRPPRRAAFVPSAARRRRRPDDATVEDLAQEALARTLVRWRRVRRGTNPAGYVYRVAFRLLARRWRRQEPAHLAADEWQVPGPQGEATTRVAVESVFDAMPPRRRLVATLCLVVGCSTAEAAKTVGIAEGTVRKHVEEARASAWARLTPKALACLRPRPPGRRKPRPAQPPGGSAASFVPSTGPPDISVSTHTPGTNFGTTLRG